MRVVRQLLPRAVVVLALASPLLAQTHYVSQTVYHVGQADCDGAPLFTEDKALLTIPINGNCTGGKFTGSVTYDFASTTSGMLGTDQSTFTFDTPLTPKFSVSYSFTPGIAVTPPYTIALSMNVRPYGQAGFDESRKCTMADIVKSGQTGPATISGTLQCNFTTVPVQLGPLIDLFSVLKVTITDKFGFQDRLGIDTSSFYNLDAAPQPNDLTGSINRVYNNKTYWIPDVPVELVDPAGNVVLKTFARENPANTLKSWYRMQLPANFDYNKDYRIHVKLQSDPDPSLAKLLVFASPSERKPVEFFSRSFRIAKDMPFTKNISIDRASADIDFSSLQTAVNLEAATEVYWNVWRELYIVRKFYDDRTLTYNLPLEVYLNAPSTFYCINAALPTCPAASSIVLQPRDSLPGGDPTVIWHEFGHYIMSEIVGGQLQQPAYRPDDTNRNNQYHFGFANSYSTLALDDGFATFWSWISSDLLDADHTPQLFYNQITPDSRAVRNDGYVSEWNWAVWDVRRSATTPAELPRGEEFAIAALLWDLFDKNADDEATTRATWTFGGTTHTAQDSISIPADQILTIFRNRKPRTLLELYNYLKADLPSTLTSLGGNPRNSGISQLDELFVMQGAFADANGNWAYDYGEAIGKAANYAPWSGGMPSGLGVSPANIAARPWRENVPPIVDSFVNLSFPGTSPSTINVAYNFGPGLEKLNTSRQYTVSSGQFYLEMPSPNYPMELVISRAGSAPLRIDNQQYWSGPRLGTLVASHTFTPITTPAPSISSLSATSAFTGATITINGSNFAPNTNDNVVHFGSALGYVLSASSTALSVLTPPIAPGSAPVTVDVGGAVSNSAAFSIIDSSACRYFVDAAGTVFTGSGGVSHLFIYTKNSCQWSIASQTSWITLDRPGAHTGNLDVQITTTPNRTGAARSGTVMINNSPLTITQAVDYGKRHAARH